ncbi:Uncharacterised protein [Neisseria meningitidis]|nr:Uncharacterised protein [Neisseria meningitidis]
MKNHGVIGNDFIRTETHRIKRFPQFHFLDSRLRGNDDFYKL